MRDVDLHFHEHRVDAEDRSSTQRGQHAHSLVQATHHRQAGASASRGFACFSKESDDRLNVPGSHLSTRTREGWKSRAKIPPTQSHKLKRTNSIAETQSKKLSFWRTRIYEVRRALRQDDGLYNCRHDFADDTDDTDDIDEIDDRKHRARDGGTGFVGSHVILQLLDAGHVASPIPAAASRTEDELIVPARDGVLRVLRPPVIPLLDSTRRATSANAQRLLGWQPRPPEEAIVATAESLIAFGVVPG